jgi:nicotinate-nucleotide--dimethylbenzimidazole phosphoribosyltransferase
VGGFEMAAIAGFVLGASESRLPVVVDGFPCCAGALAARAIDANALATTFFGHLSAERAHGLMLEALKAKPICNFGMRLGEGTGAALAISVIEAAVCLYREMATFGEAGVSEKAELAAG